MNSVMFLILLGLCGMLFSCEGVIYFPAEGKEYVFLPGSTGNITWKYDDDISALSLRAWYFTRRGGSSEQLVTIADDDRRKIRSSSLTGVEIEKPATLLLTNVNQSYNGEYQFSLTKSSSPTAETIGVQVFIAKRPTVILNCSYSNPIILNEGDDFICVCRGVDGNPPANVTWFNGSVEIGETKKENNTLTLKNVSGTANGTYKCDARSHTNNSYKDEKYVKLSVRPNSKLVITSFAADPVQPINGDPVTLTCESDGVPEPDYVIKFENGTNASTQKTYHIFKMGSTYAGIYTCIAENIKGNDSATLNLTGQETKMTNSPTTKSVGTGKADLEECKCTGGTEWYIVMVSLLSGLIIGILLSYIVSCFRRKFRSRSTQSNPESKTPEVDPTYQELDLTKMNKEDNYQSLRVNAASNVATNDDDSTYTELNQARDVENNYQSLT